MKYLLLLLLSISSMVCAADKHSDHSIGIHGMVLMLVEDKILASHMPLHHGKHAVQLIFELEPERQQVANIKQLLTDNALITLMPKTFSLTELRSGNITGFKGTVYKGHFERNGVETLNGVSFKVGKQLLNQALTNNANGAYYVVKFNRQLSLLIHRIGQVPSFDQILLASNGVQKLPLLIELNNQLPAKQLNYKGTTYLKQLYLETQDFK